MIRPIKLTRPFILRICTLTLACTSAIVCLPSGAQIWSGYAGNAQHTGLSSVGSQSLDQIIWQTPVDLNPQFSGNDLLIHYGSPLVTNANTILVPVKTGTTDGFKVMAVNGSNGSVLWQFSSDYTLPTHNWTPSYGPTLTPNGRVYMAGAGGTVYYRSNLDSPGNVAPTQISFLGNAEYNANKSSYNASIQICTPITSDANGNVYFGFKSNGSNHLSIQSGIARIAADGSASFVSANTITGGLSSQIVFNNAPALSNDGKTVYIATSNGNFTSGYLITLNSTTLAIQTKILLKDPKTSNNSTLPDDGTASTTIGPDGRVYFGVLESPVSTSKGWLQQFDSNLNSVGKPGAFGWDDTASIVPASMVASYSGTSTYLLMTKYNNYAGLGGDGVNRLAILDPNDVQLDVRSNTLVMKEVLTIAGVTPDLEFPSSPNAVREWCINTAVVDPFTDSILANSEDGKLYRWNLGTNTFTQVITLTQGIGEAYTPTLIGADGKVYAINNATLFAIGSVPELNGIMLSAAGIGLGLVALRFRRKQTY